MKTTIPIILIVLFLCSCRTNRSFHAEVLRGASCGATDELVKTKLDEAVNIFTAELDRLQRSAPQETELRMFFIDRAVANFPDGYVLKLKPFLHKGCEDSDPTVRRMAMKYAIQSLGFGGLKDISQHMTSEVRDEILQYLQTHTDATEQ